MFYNDMDINLTKSLTGDIVRDTDVDSIKNSLTNITRTIMGSRVMLPPFAFNGNELLFEPLSDEVANEVATVIWDAINTWDNRVILKHIHTNVNYDLNQYEVNITFEVLNITREPENLILIFKKE